MAKKDSNIIVNTFTKGINKDAAKYILPPDTYYDAQNVRITAHEGREGMSLVNVEGNDFLIKIPCSTVAWKIKMFEQIYYDETFWPNQVWGPLTFNITYNGQTYSHILPGGTGGNIVAQLYEEVRFSNQWLYPDGSTNTFPSEININYDNSNYELTFWSNVITNQVLNIALVDNVGNPVGWTQQTALGNSWCDLEVIGYTTIRDDIYIFTTSDESEEGGNGQVWRLQYDHSSNVAALTCMINRDDIKFTKRHPIQAIGRYENRKTQTIYWTDNFNPPRKLNVADDLVSMVVPTRFLDLAPRTSFQIPVLVNIATGGSLPAGNYQAAYRYKSAEGAVTEWSPLSNPVSIYGDSETDPFCDIEGDLIQDDANTDPGNEGNGEITNKKLVWDLQNLDVDYDIIEFAAIYRTIYRDESDNVDYSKAYIFLEQENNNSTIQFEHTGSEQKILTTISQIREGIGATFERVKTISSKDNKLFLGNIVNTSFLVDYDARAYRFINDGGLNPTALLNSQTDLPVIINGNTPFAPGPGQTAIDAVVENHDCICPYNDENPDTNPDWYTNDQYKYQSNGTILGGTGPNVSYRFITETMVGDRAVPQAGQVGNGDVMGFNGWGYNFGFWNFDFGCGRYRPWPFDGSCLVGEPPVTNNNIVNLFGGVGVQNYPMNGTIDNFKSSYKHSLYQGYARGEVYRFGIVFYNNKGQSSFVNWIGDIKFPFEYDRDLNVWPDWRGAQFSIFYWNADAGTPDLLAGQPFNYSGNMETRSLGIEFTVNLGGLDIAGQGITGYSIVRVNRDMERDASRLGQALAGQVCRAKVRGNVGGCAQNNEIHAFPTQRDNLIPIPCSQNWQGNSGCWENSLMSIDTGQDDNNANISGLGPPNANSARPLFPWGHSYHAGVRIYFTEQQTMLLYGPINWVNSSTSEQFNTDKKTIFQKGDYVKISSVLQPLPNEDYGNLPVTFFENQLGSQCNTNAPTGMWYKYYYPVSIGAGTGWNPTMTYWGGTPIGVFSQNPANLKIELEYSAWVGDGQTLSQNSDSSMKGHFCNVTNFSHLMHTNCQCESCGPGINTAYNYNTSMNLCSSGSVGLRPRSIGSECTFVTTKNRIPWPDMGMGQGTWNQPGGLSDVGATNPEEFSAGTYTRCIVNYERYSTPYGGPTFSDRTRSVYQLCNHYRPITVASNNQINEVYGGDVIVTLFDYTQYDKNWGQAPPWLARAGVIAAGLQGEEEDGGGNCNSACTMTEDELSDSEWGIVVGCVAPLEIHTANPEMRHGYHFASKGGSAPSVYPDNGTSLHDEYRYMSGYNAPNDIRKFIPVPFNVNLNEEFDTRIYYSNTKVNGETADSWGTFKVGNFKDVEGIYGPLNNLLVFGNRMMFWQDKGFGILNVNPNAIVQAADGLELQLGTVSSGTGAFIQSYEYASTKFGAKQQWAITKSDYNVFFFDILKKKFFAYGGDGNKPLSDVTGMATWFEDALQGDILKKDNPIMGEGITATYDNRHSEAIFTFHDRGLPNTFEVQYLNGELVGSHSDLMVGALRPLDNCNDCLNFECGFHSFMNPLVIEQLEYNGQTYGPIFIVVKIGCPGNPAVDPYEIGDLMFFSNDLEFLNLSGGEVFEMLCNSASKSFTLSYNEFIKGFTSFYDFHPSIYINDGKRIISPNCQNSCYTGDDSFYRDKLYMHDIGNYGQFYEYIVPSSIAVVTNVASVSTKVFDNISFHMESLQVENEPLNEDYDVQNDVFDKVRFMTDYQTSGWVNLIPGNNIKKKEREWQAPVFRNVMSDTPANNDLYDVSNYDLDRQFKDRLRDKYLMTELVYNNFNSLGQPKNIKIIMDYFRAYFRGSFR